MQKMELLDLKDIKDNKLTPNPVKFNVKRLLNEVIKITKTQLDLTDLSIVSTIEPGTQLQVIGEKDRTA